MTRAKAKYDIEAVDKTKAAVQSIEKNLKGIDKAFKTVAAAAAVVMGARGIGAGFKAAVLDTSKSFDEVAKASNRLGTNVETLQGFRFATELAGASAQDLELAWKTAGKNVSDAARGMGEGKVALEKLGISATDATGRVKSADQVMLEFADKLPQLSSEAEVTAAAMKLFGEGGAKLLPMLRQGSEAMREQIAEGRALSAVTADLAAKGEEFQDSQLRLDRSLKAIRDTVVGKVLPAFSQLAETAAFKLIAALTGVDIESRKSLESLAMLGDAEFFAAARDESEGLSDSISTVTREIEQLRAKTDAARKREASNPRQGGFSFALLKELDLLVEKEKELRRLQGLEEQLGNLVSERAANTAKDVDDSAALLKSLEGERDRLREISDTETQILASKLLQVEAYDDIAAKQREALGYLKEEFSFVEDLPMPELDWSMFTMDTDSMRGRFEQQWESASAIAADSISYNLGGGIADLITQGKTSADFFEQVWKAAIAEVAAEMARKLILKAATKFLGPLGGCFGGLFDQTANVSALPAVTGARGGGGNTYILQQQTLAPASTADFVRAARTFRESEREAARFAVGR